MWEFAPWWTTPRMTKAQIRKYIADMKKAQEIAQAKLDEAIKNWDFDEDLSVLAELEEKLKNITT